jgi:hypothetical protein
MTHPPARPPKPFTLATPATMPRIYGACTGQDFTVIWQGQPSVTEDPPVHEIVVTQGWPRNKFGWLPDEFHPGWVAVLRGRFEPRGRYEPTLGAPKLRVSASAMFPTVPDELIVRVLVPGAQAAAVFHYLIDQIANDHTEDTP